MVNVDWMMVASPSDGLLTGIWGTSSQDVWIVSSTDVFHWDGSGFTKLPPIPNCDPVNAIGMNGIWGSSSQDVWVGGCNDPNKTNGDGTGGVHRWNGTSWDNFDLKDNRSVGYLWGSGPDDVWGVSYFDNKYTGHFDGQVWAHNAVTASQPTFVANLPGPIWGGGAGDFWVAGFLHRLPSAPDVEGGQELGQLDPMIDLSNCQPDPVPWGNPHQCWGGIWGDDGYRIWAVGDHGRIWSFDGRPMNGGELTLTQSPTMEMLWDVKGRNDHDLWACGSGGQIIHYEGSHWLKVSSPTQLMLRGVFEDPSGEVWIVGEHGTILRGHL
jgi:hypothetical protein